MDQPPYFGSSGKALHKIRAKRLQIHNSQMHSLRFIQLLNITRFGFECIAKSYFISMDNLLLSPQICQSEESSASRFVLYWLWIYDLLPDSTLTVL